MIDSTPNASFTTLEALPLLKLLADDTRWRLLCALRRSDQQVGELVEQLQLPQNLVSYHLGLLRQAGLVQTHRSDADARALYYGLNLEVVHASYQRIGASLYLDPSPLPAKLPTATVLFLCTGNSARSQMAEGWLRHLSQGRVPVRSAGTHPRALHPLATRVMAEAGVDIGYQQAKAISALADLRPDVVITVCDLAREACTPVPPGTPLLHWSLPDPAAATTGDEEVQLQTFRAVRDGLRQRVGALIPLLPTLLAPSDQPTPPNAYA
jgi:ArsR family transcriptional regulator, arsenate/arsenite/antimonite-responsive transcriptional repressor / arsenate reductase (thioredoxin)